MEQAETVGVKALRAKFQEEAALAQAKNSRPAIAEKPKGIPPPGGHSCSVVNSISTTGDGNPSVAPRVIFRDGLRLSGGKRPISFPSLHSASLPPQSGGGEASARQSFKERNMPMVLPALPAKEGKREPPATKEQNLDPKPPGELSQLIKAKKKGLLLPTKSNKSSKVVDGEEPMYADLTIRSNRGPGELPSGEREKTEDRFPLHGDGLTCSSDGLITPPSTDGSGESSSGTGGSQFDQRIMSTLERTKKKFSPRQLLIYARPKSFRPNGVQSPNADSADKFFNLSSKDVETVKQDPLPSPPPVCLPHLACVSARPFVKTKGPARRVEPALTRQHSSQSAQSSSIVWPDGPPSPLKKPLPDLKSLGPSPGKPPRPPRVDLSIYKPTPPQEISPHVDNGEVPEPEQLSTTVPDAPEFPDLNSTAVEAENGAIDIAALEFEAFDFDSLELPAPVDFGVSHIESPDPGLPISTCGESVEAAELERDFGLVLRDHDTAAVPDPLNQLDIPEPVNVESWSQNEDKVLASVLESQAETTEQPVSDDPTTEEVENGHTASGGEIQEQTSVCQQGSYYETYDNVYEDVENINKILGSQHSRKRKGGPKNPYADQPSREEARPNIWPRNPWGDHGHSIHGRGHSFHGYSHRRNCQIPHTSEYKEQKKKEKHRLEKEKKERREREKKENEMKKKFKVTGQEKPLYHAKVTLASKVRKHDLPVKNGDTVGIIRTTNCPKGRWLARDASNKYGYISVMNIELNIKEMLELGKKAQAAGKDGDTDLDGNSNGSRSSNRLLHTSSFTDDSDEEWTYEHETLSPSTESCSLLHQSDSMPEMLCHHASAQHSLSDAVLEDLQTQNRHEALQKLAIFFEHKKLELNDDMDNGEPTPTNAEPFGIVCGADDPPYLDQEVDVADFELLPPPPLYADAF